MVRRSFEQNVPGLSAGALGALVLFLAQSCSPAEAERAEWVELARLYDGGDADPPAFELVLERDAWTRQGPRGRWIAHVPAAAYSPPKLASGRPTMRVDGRRAIRTRKPRSDQGRDARDPALRFWTTRGRVSVRVPDSAVPPARAVLHIPLWHGTRPEPGGPWRTRAGRITADGFLVWPGGDATFDEPLAAGSTVCFTLHQLDSPVAPDGAPSGFRLLVGEEVVFESRSSAETLAGRAHHAVRLPGAADADRPLRFATFGPNAFAVVQSPTVAPPDRPAPTRPDVLLFSADTFRADNLSAYGNALELTPRLDRLAEQSVVFERSWSSSIWTLPSHASMLFGVHPYEHGSVDERKRPGPSLVSLAEHLSDAGYRTAAVTDGGFVSESFGMGQGFEWFETRSQASAKQTVRSALERVDADDGRPTFLFVHSYRVHSPYRCSPDVMRRLGDELRLHEALERADALTKVLIEEAIPEAGSAGVTATTIRDLVRERDLRGLLDAALPILDDEGVVDESRGHDAIAPHLHRLYLGGVAAFDSQAGALLDGLEERGRLDDTVVVFTSDHGEAFGEHGLYLHHRGTWEELLRVPLLVRGPDLPPGRSSVAATSVDLPPTIAGLVGLPPDPSWSGRDLFREPDSPAFSFECSPFEAASATIVDGRWKLNVSISPPDDPGFEPTGLFDLASDPGELRDLAGDEPERVEALLDRWRDDLAATLSQRGAAEDVELTHEELDGLRALGYTGD